MTDIKIRPLDRAAKRAADPKYSVDPDILAEAANTTSALEARVMELERTIEFVNRWAWRVDPENASHKLTDSERLSAIKYYPAIRTLSKGTGQ